MQQKCSKCGTLGREHRKGSCPIASPYKNPGEKAAINRALWGRGERLAVEHVDRGAPIHQLKKNGKSNEKVVGHKGKKK